MYRAIGYYIDCDTAQCIDCFESDGGEAAWKARGGFEGWDSPIAIFEDTEADSPTHCTTCSAVIDHALTDDGYAYVLEAVAQCFTAGKQNPVTVQWIDAYGEYCGDDVQLQSGNEVHVGDMFELFRLLPIDQVWLERDDLRQHALLAGWHR